jgi:hypothetical protein
MHENLIWLFKHTASILKWVSMFGILASFCLFILSCQTIQNPVELVGKEIDLTLLEGEWEGDYYSRDTGRSGNIRFKLMAGEEKAYGDVVMIPRGSNKPYRPAGLMGEPDVSIPVQEVLSISFVKMKGGSISGTLTPYWDPDIQRRLITTFEGTLVGDDIEGSFESRIDQSPIYFYGTWKVTRKK